MNIAHNASDVVIRIKNATLAKRRETDIPLSNLNKKIVEVLAKEGFIDNVKVDAKDKHNIKVQIKYERRLPVLNGVKIVSKPSLRIYKDKKGISKIERRGKHTVIVSTSQGVMTGTDAQKKGIGGEILFEIW